MDEYYSRKPERLCERMEDAWCPEYEASGTKTVEYVSLPEVELMVKAAELRGKIEGVAESYHKTDDQRVYLHMKELQAELAGLEGKTE